jgi:RHS repeat-associated protein
MTTDPVTAKTYTYYGANNQLWTNPSPYTVFAYDALDRLQSFNTGAPVTNYVSDGSAIIAEYDGSNVLQKRYAFDGSGEPLVQYDASGNRTWMLADERGSVVALASDSGAMTAINTYDEYGIPSATNAGTFQYAGMLWLPRPNLYAPTFRAFNAGQGRFNQTDPVGIGGGVNLYHYPGNDPVNLIDPLGLQESSCDNGTCQDILVIACQNGGTAVPVSGGGYVCIPPPKDVAISDSGGDRSSGGGQGGGGGGGDQDVKQSKTQCVLQALNKNKVAIALDVAAVGAEALLAPETAAVAAIFIGGAALVNSAMNRDVEGAGLAYAGKQAGVAEGLFKGGAARTAATVTRGLIGLSAINDAAHAYEDYQKCVSSGG